MLFRSAGLGGPQLCEFKEGFQGVAAFELLHAEACAKRMVRGSEGWVWQEVADGGWSHNRKRVSHVSLWGVVTRLSVLFTSDH